MPGDVPAVPMPLCRQFPSLRLIEAAEIALSPVSLTMAILASLLLGASGWLVERVDPLRDSDVENPSVALVAIPGVDSAICEALVKPWSSVAGPVMAMVNSSAGMRTRSNGLMRFVLAISLWSLVGIILCRRSALQFAGNGESPIATIIDYGIRRWPATIGAPMIPLAAVLLIGLIVVVLGMVGRMPGLGWIWLWLASPLLALFGLAMAFLSLATFLGWPLMVAAVATDDCDSFGSLSRAYSGMTGRPWHVAGRLLITIAIGVALMFVTQFLADTGIWCALSSTAIGSGEEQARNSMLVPVTNIIQTIVSAVGISFFWSAATINYLLLRREIDGVPLERLAEDDDARPARDPLPVVGIPATDAKNVDPTIT